MRYARGPPLGSPPTLISSTQLDCNRSRAFLSSRKGLNRNNGCSVLLLQNERGKTVGKILFTSIETASIIHSFLKEQGNVLAYPFFVEDYQVLDAMIDPDNNGLVKVRIVYKKEKPELLTLASNGPTCRFLLSQIPAIQVERPDLPKRVYLCEQRLGIYTNGNPYISDVKPVEEKDLEVGRAYIRILGYVQNTPVPQLCWAARQIDECGKKERVVLSPMQDTELYTEILVAYLTCQRTVKQREILSELGKTSQIYLATGHLIDYLLPVAMPPYTPYINLMDVSSGTRVAFLDCSCQKCEFHKHTSDGGPGRRHARGGYNWGNIYPNCAVYGSNKPGNYIWIWCTERVRQASIAYVKGPILALPVPPALAYETGNFQIGAWISIWRYGEQYVGIVQSVVERYQGSVCYGERCDVQTTTCDTPEQAEAAARTLWLQIQRQDERRR